MYEPIAADLAVRLARYHAQSALPDAPVIPDDPPRVRRQRGRVTVPFRTAAAGRLRQLAGWVEPKRRAEPVC
ncbi:MAG: hypothetical protein ACRDO4_17525 [Nocardioides sp.]